MNKTTIRILGFLLIFLSALFLPFWFFILLGVLYGFYYQPHELMIIGILIDAQFGEAGGGMIYHYTAAMIILSIILFFLKPHLRLKS